MFHPSEAVASFVVSPPLPAPAGHQRQNPCAFPWCPPAIDRVLRPAVGSNAGSRVLRFLSVCQNQSTPSRVLERASALPERFCARWAASGSAPSAIRRRAPSPHRLEGPQKKAVGLCPDSTVVLFPRFLQPGAFVRAGLRMEGLGGRQAGQGTILSSEWDAAGRGFRSGKGKEEKPRAGSWKRGKKSDRRGNCRRRRGGHLLPAEKPCVPWLHVASGDGM